jgi:hypothetical protein
MVPETGIEPVRPFSGKRRILSPLCLPISPLGQLTRMRADECNANCTGSAFREKKKAP